jgi:hypothetical protein
MNTAVSPMRRAELLVHTMTLDEKILKIHDEYQGAPPRSSRDRLRIPTGKRPSVFCSLVTRGSPKLWPTLKSMT